MQALALCKQAEGGAGAHFQVRRLKTTVLATSLDSKEGIALKRLVSCPREGLCCYSPDLDRVSERGSHCVRVGAEPSAGLWGHGRC